ncbi:hypothetical protein LTR36_002320 [Oleoguttula mirabilis]|uniref:Uncharacterized protein n=1 Tax=Oleoguttula mirabilis TaxID=1507867 RepID=A0AAV9JLM6_9PEZI|nr:hypothetical protein LTR36_002320 [Oleoguttula mirabilis]
MFPRQTFFALALLCAVSAETFNFAHGACSFVAYNGAGGVAVAKTAYKSCVERTNGDGSKTANGVDCVFDAMTYCFQAASVVLSGGYGVSFIEDNFGGATEEEDDTKPPTGKRSTSDELLNYINSQLNAIHGGDGPMAHAIVRSDIHPSDGFAVRTNVRGSNGTLHLHTNGTHGLSQFHDVENGQTTLRERAFLPTENHYFNFDGLDGLKMQWHTINHPSDASYAGDLKTIMDRFTRSNFQTVPEMRKSDAWVYQVCNSAKTATFFYGKIIFELNTPGREYEAVDPPRCG